VRLNGERAGALELRFVLGFEDAGDRFEVSIENGVLHHRRADGPPDISLTRTTLVQLALGQTSLAEAGLDDAGPLATFLGLLDRFDFWFNIVTP